MFTNFLKTAAPPSSCIVVEERALILFWCMRVCACVRECVCGQKALNRLKVFGGKLAQHCEHCMAQKYVILIRDSARPLPAAVDVTRQMKFENPPYTHTHTHTQLAHIPDLAPSDYYMLGPVTGALLRRRFAGGDEDMQWCTRCCDINRKFFKVCHPRCVVN